MKTIVNVYKHAGLWEKPPPGIGDFLRGCAFLIQAAEEGPYAGLYEPGVNLDLTPAARLLVRSDLHRLADPDKLAAAPEFFYPERDGDVATAIEAFLESDAETLLVSTNHSWRGIDEPPPRPVLDQLASVLHLAPEFAAKVDARYASLGPGYILLHIRDADRGGVQAPMTGDEQAYGERARRYIDQVKRAHPERRFVLISNNQRLRSLLCRQHNISDPGTAVANTGFSGILGEGDLLDAALIARADMLYALSYFAWNSGFSVWSSRLFNVPAQFANGFTDL